MFSRVESVKKVNRLAQLEKAEGASTLSCSQGRGLGQGLTAATGRPFLMCIANIR
jgi:hypothetical protein